MTELEQPLKKKVERIELCAELIDKANRWLKQIEESCPEVDISRKELLNFFLLELNESLSETQLSKIRGTFYDQVKYLESLLRKAKLEKAVGQPSDLPPSLLPTFGKKKKRQKKVHAQASIAEDLSPEAPENS